MRTRPIGQTGLTLSTYGFGCAPLGNVFSTLTDDACHELLEAAWAGGIRFFDTAPLYGGGLSERRIGAFLRDKPRDAFVVSTKVGRRLSPDGAVAAEQTACVFDYSYDGVMRSYEDSLKRLGLDRVDVLLMHDIGSLTHGAAHPAVFEEAMTGDYAAFNSNHSRDSTRKYPRSCRI